MTNSDLVPHRITPNAIFRGPWYWALAKFVGSAVLVGTWLGILIGGARGAQ